MAVSLPPLLWHHLKSPFLSLLPDESYKGDVPCPLLVQSELPCHIHKGD